MKGRFTRVTFHMSALAMEQAVASTLLSIALALPAAYALYRLALPARRTLLAVVTVPFILPTVVVGLAFREILPFAGTTAAIIVAHVFFNVGLVVRIVGGLAKPQGKGGKGKPGKINKRR